MDLLIDSLKILLVVFGAYVAIGLFLSLMFVLVSILLYGLDNVKFTWIKRRRKNNV